jgi:hypothetical protein
MTPSMDRERFTKHLLEATEVVLPFSRTFLVDPLPDDCRYLVSPNISYDGNPLEGDEEIFPQESLPGGKHLGPFNIDEVVDLLHRNEKVPEWINVTVHSYDSTFTYLQLLCCGRFTAQDEYLYHKPEGFPPFHGLGPNLPPDWESVEKDGRFELGWLENRNKIHK